VAGLKDRRGRELNSNGRRHYETFATTIKKALDELSQLESTWQALIWVKWIGDYQFDAIPVS